jgi:hypothetical protein
MEIPKKPLDRLLFYQELVRQCAASRINRFTLYQTLRNYYLFGSQDNKGAPYNKIASTIETLGSFIYSADSTRFSLHLGTTASEDDVFKAQMLAKEVTEQWRLSKTHLLFGLAIRWAMVFGIMLMKSQWTSKSVRSYLVEPHQFGVLREDIMDLTDQEAFTHHYTITRTQLMSSLEGNPRKTAIEQELALQTQGDVPRTFSEGLSRLIIGGPVSGIPGSVAIGSGMTTVEGGMGSAGRGPAYDYAPKVEAELIDMVDLYVWSDEDDEYQLVTQAAPGVTIYDRKASEVGHVKGVPPFTVIRAHQNLYDYFWNDSFVAKIAWLQDWRTRRVLEINRILSRQADPPLSLTGMGGIAEEKAASFRAAGGLLSMPTPTGKAEFHPPDLPGDMFAEVAQIDSMFDDQAGLGHILQGRGEAGVRSRGQADLMARLGSSRPKERAMAVEESAEDLARLILLTTQDHSEQRFSTKLSDGRTLTFVAEQFTKDYEVKVDGHSSSPIFTEDTKHDAVTLLEAKAITRATFLKMFDPPDLQALLEDLKQIEKAEKEMMERQAQMEAQGAAPHHGPRKAA